MRFEIRNFKSLCSVLPFLQSVPKTPVAIFRAVPVPAFGGQEFLPFDGTVLQRLRPSAELPCDGLNCLPVFDDVFLDGVGIRHKIHHGEHRAYLACRAAGIVKNEINSFVVPRSNPSAILLEIERAAR